MIQGLPVIPEDDVLVCQSYNFNDAIFHNERKWQQNTSSASTATTTVSSLSSSSYFGYVAILRDGIILLEVGRPSSIAINTENNSRFNDNDIVIDECIGIDNSLYTLDKTIYGTLQREVIPGWDTFTLHNKNDNKRFTSTSPWVGLRFHIYDDTINNQNDDFAIWSFCIVFYRGDTVTSSESESNACHDNYTQQKMWMIQNLVQFTESFRQNDVVWKTGSTFSCQYIFAPAIQQRIQQKTSSMWNHKSKPTNNEFNDEDDTLSLDYEWEEVAENLIKRNISIAETMSLAIKKEESTTMVPVVPIAYQHNNSNNHKTTTKESECSLPFVSDESDDDNVSMDNEDDYESSDDDMDESSARRNQYQQSTTPIRAGAFPSNYGKCNGNVDDDDMAYLDRIVASNSIWKSVSSEPCTNILLTLRSTATSHNTTKVMPLESNTCNITKKDSDTDTDSDNDDNSNGDDENIPMICLVSGQVDAQHSDLWKRSPKSISKAVALGISSPPTPTAQMVVQSLDKIEQPSSFSPWEHVTNTITKMIDIVLHHDTQSSLTNNRNSCNDEPSINKSNELDNDRKCFWCDSLFSPKVSAIIIE